MMLYGKASWVVADLSFIDISGNPIIGTIDASERTDGYSFGGGIALALPHNWVFGFEYERLQLDQETISGRSTTNVAFNTVGDNSIDADIFSIRLTKHN